MYLNSRTALYSYIYIQLHTILNWTLHINSLHIDFSLLLCPRESTRKKELLAILSENTIRRGPWLFVKRNGKNGSECECGVVCGVNFFFPCIARGLRGRRQEETVGFIVRERVRGGIRGKIEGTEWRKFSYEGTARVRACECIYGMDARTCVVCTCWCVCMCVSVCYGSVFASTDGWMERFSDGDISPDGSFRDGKISRLSFALSRYGAVSPSAESRVAILIRV